MKVKRDLKFTITDEYGSTAVVPSHSLDRITGSQEIAKLFPEFYGEELFDACPACGQTPELAHRSTLMGCPICYTTIYAAYLALAQNPNSS
ncbi:hypothetical protein C0431_07650 [bacterium]|nr:hypothetical protein [bacterium]